MIFVALLVVDFFIFTGDVVFEPDDDDGRRKRFSDVFKSVFTRRVVPGENDIFRTSFWALFASLSPENELLKSK